MSYTRNTQLMKSMGKGLYRSRLAEKPDEPAGRFMSSLDEDQEIMIEDIIGTEAHDIMLYEQGIIPKKDLKKILQALEELRGKFEKGTLNITGDYEDVHEFLEDGVIKKVGIDAGGKLHTARSRNDQVALDIRMKTRTELNDICQKLIELIQTFLTKAHDTIHVPIILYTHTQHAQIGNLAHYFLAQVDLLSRDLERLNSCYSRVNRSPLGASAVGGTKFPIDRSRTASLLGFDGIVENSVDAVSSRDFALETIACLAVLMVSMSRICEDLIIWSSSEFGYVELSDAYASTSSIMPQKKNPCTLELIRGRTGEVSGALIDLIICVKGLPTGYSRDLQAIKPSVWRALKAVRESLEVMSGAISGLKVNEEQWVEATQNSYAVAVDLAEDLTAKGIPFRQSHRIVGELVRELVESKSRMKDITPELVSSLSEKIIGKKLNLTDTELSRIIDPIHSLEARQSLGSPSQKEVDRMLQDREKKVEEYAVVVRSRTEKLGEANSRLKRTVDEYISS